MTEDEILKAAITGEVEVHALNRNEIRSLDCDDDSTLMVLDEAQGSAGDSGFAVIIVHGQPLA